MNDSENVFRFGNFCHSLSCFLFEICREVLWRYLKKFDLFIAAGTEKILTGTKTPPKLSTNVSSFKSFFAECDNFMIVYGVSLPGVGGEVRRAGSSSGRGNCAVFLHFTITVPLSNEVHKWVPAN